MPDPYQGAALGLVETRGLIGVIEAADAATKAAAVDIISIERAKGGLVQVAFAGDVASVKEAVTAASERAAGVGELVSSHVIARPDSAVWKLLTGNSEDTVQEKTDDETVTDIPPSTPDNGSHAMEIADLADLPVRELRRRARSFEGIDMSGREISSASKAELLEAFTRALESRQD